MIVYQCSVHFNLACQRNKTRPVSGERQWFVFIHVHEYRFSHIQIFLEILRTKSFAPLHDEKCRVWKRYPWEKSVAWIISLSANDLDNWLAHLYSALSLDLKLLVEKWRLNYELARCRVAGQLAFFQGLVRTEAVFKGLAMILKEKYPNKRIFASNVSLK